MDNDIATLRAELAALRRQVRALTWGILAVLGAVVLLLVFRRGPAAGFVADAEILRTVEVDAQEFRLFDPDGNLRGAFRCPPAGPALNLFDAQGRVVASVAADPPSLSLADGLGMMRLRADVTAGEARLILLGKNGQPQAQVELSTTAEGGSLRLRGPDGKVSDQRP